MAIINHSNEWHFQQVTGFCTNGIEDNNRQISKLGDSPTIYPKLFDDVSIQYFPIHHKPFPLCEHCHANTAMQTLSISD